MSNIFPVSLIVISVIIILMIVIRKFPQLAILDVENMPQEKAERIKERLIKNRLERDLSRWNSKFSEVWKFLSKRFNFLFSWLTKLRAEREKYRDIKQSAQITKEEKIELLLGQARELAKTGETDDLNEAETKLIEVASLDKKCLPAFSELGNVYDRMKKYPEARQTYLYCLRLLEFKDDKKEEAEINYQLSQVNKELGGLDESLNNVIESLKIEPNNPRFLDAMLDLCVLRKDKALAEETLKRLNEVNPENQKLADWREKINNLSD